VIEERTLAHEIRPGEDPFEIAARYDEAPRWLRRWNRLEADSKLRPGRRLTVRARRRPPARQALEYEVQPGDTVDDVARAHGISDRALARILHTKTRGPLEAGLRIELWSEPTLMRWLASPEGVAMKTQGIWGGYGVGAPDDGYLANAVAIPQDPAWDIRFPHQVYGDSWAVQGAIEALRNFRNESGYQGPLRVWSMSRRYGGEIAAHHSHRTGRDLDIKLPLRADLSANLAVRPEWIDTEATWKLITALADTGRVQKIFLDHEIQKLVERKAARLGVPEARRRELLSAPRPRLSKEGLVRHYEGHEDHIHVRFTCPPWGIFCTDR
jgi:murein endopeptidase